MTPHALSIHEASHAVAGICVGWADYLVRVSIVSSERWAGGCEWRDYATRIKSDEEDASTSFAGPIGQTLYAPESLDGHANLFAASINQPNELLAQSGQLGWLGTSGIDGDLRYYRLRNLIPPPRFGVRTEFFIKTRLEQIEDRTQDLLRRPTVAAAIQNLGARLVVDQEISGAAATSIVRNVLEPHDYVSLDFFTKVSSAAIESCRGACKPSK